MNILSLITTILIVFSIISSFMIKAHKDSAAAIKSIKGYYIADMNLKNSYEHILYNSQKRKKTPVKKGDSSSPYTFPKGHEENEKGKDENKDKNKNDDDKKTPSKKKRKKKKVKKIYPCSLINLSLFTKDDNFEKRNSYLLFIKILKTFYLSEFSKKITPEKFANALILKLKQHQEKKKTIDLEKINFKNISYQSIWYFLLKGNSAYSFEKKVNDENYNKYPSILEFIVYNSTIFNKKDELCINKISKEMIYAFYGNKISKEIFKIQSSKKKITKEKLEKILRDANDLDIEKNLNLFCYTHSKNHPAPNRFIAKDKENNVSIYKKEY